MTVEARPVSMQSDRLTPDGVSLPSTMERRPRYPPLLRPSMPSSG